MKKNNLVFIFFISIFFLFIISQFEKKKLYQKRLIDLKQNIEFLKRDINNNIADIIIIQKDSYDCTTIANNQSMCLKINECVREIKRTTEIHMVYYFCGMKLGYFFGSAYNNPYKIRNVELDNFQILRKDNNEKTITRGVFYLVKGDEEYFLKVYYDKLNFFTIYF